MQRKHAGQGGSPGFRLASAWPEGRRGGATKILWILLLALGLRAFAWLYIDPVAFDSAGYFEIADLIRAGEWSRALAHPYPPLYPILIAAVQVWGVGTETAGLLIAVAADLLVLFPLVGIARIAIGEAVAWGAAFLWAIHPLAVRLGVQALSDAPTAMFVAFALWAGLKALEEGRLVWALGAGAASGLAYLLRPEGIEPALALAALYALRTGIAAKPHAEIRTPPPVRQAAPLTLSGGPSRRLLWLVTPLAGWILIASPYIVYISLEAGSFTLSKKKSASTLFHSLTAPRSDEGQRTKGDPGVALEIGHAAAAQAWFTGDERRAKGGAREHDAILQPARTAINLSKTAGKDVSQSWMRHMARGAYIFQKPLINGLHPLILVFGIVAALGIRSHRSVGSRWARMLLVSLLTLHFVVLLGLAADLGPAYLGRHHFLLMVLYALPFAGAGLVSTLAWGTDRLRATRWLPVVALGCLSAIPVVMTVTRGPDRGTAVRPAAAWIQSQVVGTPVIVTNIAKLTYHARAERVELGGAYDDILRRSRARSSHFVVFYPDLIREASHDFLARLNPSDLELVKTFPEPSPLAPDQRLEVYRFRPR